MLKKVVFGTLALAALSAAAGYYWLCCAVDGATDLPEDFYKDIWG